MLLRAEVCAMLFQFITWHCSVRHSMIVVKYSTRHSMILMYSSLDSKIVDKYYTCHSMIDVMYSTHCIIIVISMVYMAKINCIIIVHFIMDPSNQ